MSSEKSILIDHENGVATVWLNRPNKYNALDTPMVYYFTHPPPLFFIVHSTLLLTTV